MFPLTRVPFWVPIFDPQPNSPFSRSYYLWLAGKQDQLIGVGKGSGFASLCEAQKPTISRSRPGSQEAAACFFVCVALRHPAATYNMFDEVRKQEVAYFSLFVPFKET